MTAVARVMPLRLGCLADDFTGATDLATALRRAGLTPALVFGLPDDGLGLADGCDAVVVALKSRTVAAAEAVRQARAVRAWLEGRGARQIYFKYCSTFDSTAEGNIGPVADALLDDLGAALAVVCPATPENGRTVYQGQLFVDGRPLAESSMRHHPLTPMTDSDLRRLLGRQTASRVGLVPLQTVARGPAAVRSALAALAADGMRFAVADAVFAGDLETLGAACADVPLVTGAAGLGWGLGRAVAEAGHGSAPPDLSPAPGPAGVLAGSCSARTLEQVEHARARFRAFRIDAAAVARGEDVAAAAHRWIDEHVGETPLLLYSTVTAEELAAVQATVGVGRSARLLEELHGALARRLVDRGVSRLIVAGGETAGAVISALGVRSVLVGADVDPGVPWTYTTSGERLALMLKSGNFGRPDLFTRALEG